MKALDHLCTFLAFIHMVSFATEFPVKPIPDRATFIAQVVAWLRGINNSTVLDDRHNTDLEGETAYLQSRNGEELRLREFGRDGNFEAIGFRHDLPDEEGRLWRTEAVVRRCAASENQDLIRLNTQCIARAPGVRLLIPRKPYLIKMILSDVWGGKDGALDIVDQPLWLANDDRSLRIACDVTLGKASQYLPVIYISATGLSQWLLSRQQIEKLAYDLGGVAHVIVEPSRNFSFRLRDETEGTNVYNGTLGIALSGQGMVRRFYLDWQLLDGSDLLPAIKSAALAMRSQMPAVGWDWTELQEQALRKQRERNRNRLSVEEIEQLYQEEIDNLRERNKRLEEQLAARGVSEVPNRDDRILPEPLIMRIGPEVYPGEIADRMRLAARSTLDMADRIGLDRRSKAILEKVIENLPPSRALSELFEDLRRTTKDSGRISSDVTALLVRHGYYQKSDNKHIRLESKEKYIGLETITLPKTPSERRGLQNLRKQIERALGITKLRE